MDCYLKGKMSFIDETNVNKFFEIIFGDYCTLSSEDTGHIYNNQDILTAATDKALRIKLLNIEEDYTGQTYKEDTLWNFEKGGYKRGNFEKMTANPSMLGFYGLYHYLMIQFVINNTKAGDNSVNLQIIGKTQRGFNKLFGVYPTEENMKYYCDSIYTIEEAIEQLNELKPPP